MRKRIFSLMLVCVVLCSCVFVRVSAVYDPTKPIDYTELDYSVKYGSEFNQVTVSIPEEYYYHQVTSGGVTSHQVGGETFEFNFYPGKEVDLGEFPSGYRGLLLENIPVGSILQFEFRVELSAPVDPDWIPTFLKRSVYQDSNGGWIGSYSTSEISGRLDQVYVLEYVIEDKANAYAFVPSLAINDWGSYSMSNTVATVIMEDVRLVMDISSDYWSKWQAGQNGKMLEEIKDTIENSTDEITGAIGDSTDKITGTLEDQWNADIEGSSPDGSDIIDNADKVESEIRDDAQAGLDKGAEIQQEASNILKSDNIAQALLCSAKIFETFANIPFFAGLLVVSVSLGIFALLVNLANSFASWHRGNVREAQREQRRQEAADRYSRKHR